MLPCVALIFQLVALSITLSKSWRLYSLYSTAAFGSRKDRDDGGRRAFGSGYRRDDDYQSGGGGGSRYGARDRYGGDREGRYERQDEGREERGEDKLPSNYTQYFILLQFIILCVIQPYNHVHPVTPTDHTLPSGPLPRSPLNN